jgi:hypothetical protein
LVTSVAHSSDRNLTAMRTSFLVFGHQVSRVD